MERRDEMFDLAPALVRGRGEGLEMIVDGQTRREEADRSQRQRAIGSPIEDDGEPPRREDRFDAAIGRVLRQMQHLRAVFLSR
jgi:hypothetical protein